MTDNKDHRSGNTNLTSGHLIPDFIRKLHSLLEDERHVRVVSWGDYGKSFIVKDQSEFSKSILPMHFKHSNFASFVRQLNKYDFHKVKRNNDDDIMLYGEHAWEFDHPMFQRNRHDLLEGIRRKCANKSLSAGPSPQGACNTLLSNGAGSSSMTTNASQIAEVMSQVEKLQQELDATTRLQEETAEVLKRTTIQCEILTNDLQEAYHGLASRDKLMNQIVQYLIDSRPDQTTFSNQLKQLIETHADAITVFERHLDRLNIPPNSSSSMSSPVTMLPSPPLLADGFVNSSFLQQLQASPTLQPHTTASMAAAPIYQQYTQPLMSINTSGLSTPAATASLSSPTSGAPMISPMQPVNNISEKSQLTSVETPKNKTSAIVRKRKQLAKKAGNVSELEARRPSWLQPPKVLLVEDDVVCRRLSGRILQIFGCTLDEAEDGLTAVNKMNISKYDLVLMDIMMPHLDGMSATAQIRQFDRCTPIDARIVYMSCGMNDVLPKPFSKDTLLSVVEKYCVHLIRSQAANSAQMTFSIPRPFPSAGAIEEFENNVTNKPNNVDAIALFPSTIPGSHNQSSHELSNNNSSSHSSMIATTAALYGTPLSAVMLDVAQKMVNWNEPNMAAPIPDHSAVNALNTGMKRTFIEFATATNPSNVHHQMTMPDHTAATSNHPFVYNLNQAKRTRISEIV
ncbi:HSF-type DNA-binding-domain-containing protein [Syncephalis fuscata]|nr:HSF-type DNA-binding-domain-containing protein [Syncephalis fuscata]